MCLQKHLTASLIIIFILLMFNLALYINYSSFQDNHKLKIVLNMHPQLFSMGYASLIRKQRNATNDIERIVKKRILTFCTTYPDDKNKRYIIENSFKVLLSLQPDIKPVFFYTSDNVVLQDLALSYHIDVHACPVETSVSPKTCVLPAMMLFIQQKYNSTFYGYSNGDLLFTTGLVNTLYAIQSSNYVNDMNNKILVTGKRSNLDMPFNCTITSATEVEKLRPKAKLFTGYAVDYLISTNGGFPWNAIPPVAVGRLGYDNFIVGYAMLNGLTVIDATKTVLAVHQTSHEGNYAGHAKRISGKGVNYALIGRTFDYASGQVDCAQLRTEQLNKANISLAVKSKYPCNATFSKLGYDPYKDILSLYAHG